MSARAAIVTAALAVAIHAALLAGVVPLPEGVRVTLAAAVFLLAPGLAWCVLLDVRPPGGAWLLPAWALGMGVAWNAVLVSLCAIVRVPFTSLAAASLPMTGLLWIVLIRREHVRGATPAAVSSGGSPRDAEATLRGAALVLTLAAAAVAAVHAARLGALIAYSSDSPDHIATVRRMIESRTLFPNDAFFRDPGAFGVDPRKFLWHAEVAVITTLARVSPLVAWQSLPALLSPLLVLNAAAFGALLGGGASAAVAAWALLFTYGSSINQATLRESVFATRLADQVALAATVALLADVVRPRRSMRLAAVALAVGAAAAHLFAAFQFAIVSGALAVGLLIRDRGASAPLKRLAVTALAMGAAVLPFTLWQVLRAPPPVNPIHIEPQGLMGLWDGVRVVSPDVLWEWMGFAWLSFPLLAVLLWREGRSSVAVLSLLTSALGAAVLMFVPPIVSLLQPRMGYLLMRVVWIAPLSGLMGWAIPKLTRDAFRRPSASRLRAALLLGITLLLLLPGVSEGVYVLTHDGVIAKRERERSPLLWRPELEELDARLAPGSVVLADPLTSYAVPMLTRDHVVTMLDQHSSPADGHALDRVLDSRDALDPYADWSRVREILGRYGVDAIVLNRRFNEDPPADYWRPRASWFIAERERLDRHPAAFERMFYRGDFVAYRVRRPALDLLLDAPPARPFVRLYRPGLDPIGHRMVSGMPSLLGVALSPRIAAPGDSLHGLILWRSEARLPAGSYQVAVRFDRALPGTLTPPAFLAKPVRKLIERWRHERYRFRSDHLPVAGDYGVDQWKSGEVVRDSFFLIVPADVADGDYAVRVRMIRQPHYPNLRLGDYFFDDDYFSGILAAEFEVARAGARAPSSERGTSRGSEHVRH